MTAKDFVRRDAMTQLRAECARLLHRPEVVGLTFETLPVHDEIDGRDLVRVRLNAIVDLGVAEEEEDQACAKARARAKTAADETYEGILRAMRS